MEGVTGRQEWDGEERSGRMGREWRGWEGGEVMWCMRVG